MMDMMAIIIAVDGGMVMDMMAIIIAVDGGMVMAMLRWENALRYSISLKRTHHTFQRNQDRMSVSVHRQFTDCK